MEITVLIMLYGVSPRVLGIRTPVLRLEKSAFTLAPSSQPSALLQYRVEPRTLCVGKPSDSETHAHPIHA